MTCFDVLFSDAENFVESHCSIPGVKLLAIEYLDSLGATIPTNLLIDRGVQSKENLDDTFKFAVPVDISEEPARYLLKFKRRQTSFLYFMQSQLFLDCEFTEHCANIEKLGICELLPVLATVSRVIDFCQPI